jgi:F-type H+/Na+-transporting ATPase subunit alpha
MKKVAGRLRLDLAQFRELEAFAQFGSDLDKATQAQLARGARMVEILKQGLYQPNPVENQVAILWAATNGMLDEIEIEDVRAYEKAYLEYLNTNKAAAMEAIRTKKELTDEIVTVFRDAAKVVKGQFKAPVAV